MTPIRLVTDVPPPGPAPAGGAVGHLPHAGRPDPERVAELLTDVGPEFVLLVDVRAVTVPVARGMGVPVLLLPADADRAGAVVAVATAWAASGDDPGLRGVEALVSAADGADTGDPAPPGPRAVRLLARWARRAWRACPVCDGGGVAGGRCARCRWRIPEDAA